MEPQMTIRRIHRLERPSNVPEYDSTTFSMDPNPRLDLLEVLLMGYQGYQVSMIHIQYLEWVLATSNL